MNKKKVGVLTLVGKRYNDNIGAILQAYALQNTIRKLGFECEIIDFEPPIYTKKSTKKSMGIVGSILHSLKIHGFKWTLLKVFDNTLGLGLKNRKKAERKKTESCNNFKKAYLNFTSQSFKNKEPLKHLDYDIYIVGSDVVWSPEVVYDVEVLKAYLLEFIKNKKKVSYAASVWHPIPDWLCPIYKNLLRDFDFVSVREKTSAEYLKKCGIEIDPEIVLDPTLLLSKEEWKKISKPPEKTIKRPYMMVYDVHTARELLSEVFSIAKRKGINIVTRHPLFIELNNPKVYSFYTSSPAEFLWLIENAEYIITTSFHGTIFSVLFQKPFYSIKPYLSPSNKIVDFLKIVGLEDRFVQNPKDLKSLSFDDNIDWRAVENALKKEINHSIRFLKKALKGDANETGD